MKSVKKQIQYVEENTEFRIERYENVRYNGYKAISMEYSRPHSENTRFTQNAIVFEDEIVEFFIN